MKRKIITITAILILLFNISFISVLADVKTIDSQYTTQNDGGVVCSKCGKSLNGDKGEQSQLAKALGLTLCMDCWINAFYGDDNSYVIPEISSSNGSSPTWGNIAGTLSNQTDLQGALNSKLSSYTETDPIYSVSVAHNIQANDITNWNNAVSQSHSHGNIAILNAIQESFTTSLKSSYDWLVTNITSAWKTTVDNHISSPHAPSNAQKNSDITKEEIEAKLTGQISSHTHAGSSGGMTTLMKGSNQIINSGAGVFTDITDLTFPVTSGKMYAFHYYITFQSASTSTGWKAGVNCPTGILDFWAQSDVIANGAAGVATHTERHNVNRDDMTLLTSTITQNVDLNVFIEGRYLCTQNGTFAARFANELGANTQIVVQQGSWGWYFSN